MKQLYIMRGISGSGKSTMVKGIIDSIMYISDFVNWGDFTVISADNFFIRDNGEYVFNPAMLGFAHKTCQMLALAAIDKEDKYIFIDNTNVTLWELKQYKHVILRAINKGYSVEIREPNTEWAFNVQELFARNTHGVPLHTIERRLKEWVPNVSVSDIIS